MKKLIPFLFVLFLLIPLAFAVKTTQTFANVGGTDGLVLRFPQKEILKQNTNFSFNSHVFNLSNGVAMGNGTASCYLYLFNKTGESLISDKPVLFGNDIYDFTIEIDGNNFTELGVYSYIFQCNTTDLGGFASGSFIVTADGTKNTEADSLKLIAALLGILILTSIFIKLAFKLDEEHYLLKLFFMLMTIITLMIIPQLIIKGISTAEENILRITLWMFYIFVVYVFFYIFYNWARKSERFLRWFGHQK